MRKRRFQRATEEIEGIRCLARTSACGRVRDIEVKGDPSAFHFYVAHPLWTAASRFARSYVTMQD
jgi:hypothetical protein